MAYSGEDKQLADRILRLLMQGITIDDLGVAVQRHRSWASRFLKACSFMKLTSSVDGTWPLVHRLSQTARTMPVSELESKLAECINITKRGLQPWLRKDDTQ